MEALRDAVLSSDFAGCTVSLKRKKIAASCDVAKKAETFACLENLKPSPSAL